MLTPSERNKIRVLDAMDQDMPDSDAPSQFNQDLAARRKIFEDAEQIIKTCRRAVRKNRFTNRKFSSYKNSTNGNI
jgi:hypothetical protein